MLLKHCCYRFDRDSRQYLSEMTSDRRIFSWRRTFDGVRHVYLAARNERKQKGKKGKNRKNEKGDRRCGRKGRKTCRWRWGEDRSSDRRCAFDLQRRNFIISDTRVSSLSSRWEEEGGWKARRSMLWRRSCVCSGQNRSMSCTSRKDPLFASAVVPPRNLSSSFLVRSNFRRFKVERAKSHSRCHFILFYVSFLRSLIEFESRVAAFR